MAKSENQTKTGKAFEYACANAIVEKFKDKTDLVLEDSPQLRTAQRFFECLDESEKLKYQKGALAAIKIIERLEPKLSASNSKMHIRLQTDSKGVEGDVRDVLCLRGASWQIGLSCKHNHEAVKHSRLSDTIDFGKEWFNRECSKEYFARVKELFAPLRKSRDESKESGDISPLLWKEIPDKEERYYVPVLEAFMEELKRLNANYTREIPAKLIRYLIGRNDFYKVIMNDTREFTKIESVNINGTLGQSLGSKRALVDAPILKLPTKFYEIGFKEGSKNTIVIVCDEGWNVSMRIHNASSKVEPSLKFDVQLMAKPSSILTQIEPWE